MSLGDRILGGLKTIVLIEERTKSMAEAVAALRALAEARIGDHERRLVRIETMIEIARPDGAVLRIAPASD